MNSFPRAAFHILLGNVLAVRLFTCDLVLLIDGGLPANVCLISIVGRVGSLFISKTRCGPNLLVPASS